MRELIERLKETMCEAICEGTEKAFVEAEAAEKACEDANVNRYQIARAKAAAAALCGYVEAEDFHADGY